MRKGISALWLACTFTLVLGVSLAWAYDCPNLYAECQELLKTNKNEEAKKMCEEGIKLHKAGEHDAAVEKLETALDLLEEKK